MAYLRSVHSGMDAPTLHEGLAPVRRCGTGGSFPEMTPRVEAGGLGAPADESPRGIRRRPSRSSGLTVLGSRTDVPSPRTRTPQAGTHGPTTRGRGWWV